MKASLIQDLVMRIPFASATSQVGKSSIRYLPDSSGQYKKSSQISKQSKANSVFGRMNKFGRKADSFAHEVREHVRLGPKITDTVKGKLSLGARILQVGGVEKIFMRFFSVKEEEKLLKASQCYLSTTSGPIAGLLFISTEKVAFCSEKSIKLTSPEGDVIRVHYKVSVPLGKIKSVNQSKNVKKPSQKYLEIVTMDNFDFWFMGFLNFQKTFKYLQHAVSRC
ncbi:GEM-like protein 4 [Neltuma alba]|uniref:GEM-like protein 4 n=1 Tax=Neltuma alba TaxID=207710 RepID=UPI0010A4B766|nr:GEM-like protein 4 [Prosopis alba]